MEFKVTKECRLLDFLFEQMPDRSRTTVKSYLTHRQVSVGDTLTTRFDYALSAGDTVSVSRQKGKPELQSNMLRIVYEDDAIIVIDKREGLLSMATDKEQQRTAYYILSEYVKAESPQNRIFIIHRLDRETSGLMVFARSEEIQEKMQRSWRETIIDRRYVAVTEGTPDTPEGTIETFLTEDRNHKVWVSRDEEGDKAVTHFRVIASGNRYALLDLKLQTGRKNQIRAHLEWLKHPIAGDKKYGAQTNPLRRVCLHAYRLHLCHPVDGRELHFETPVPKSFSEIVK